MRTLAILLAFICSCTWSKADVARQAALGTLMSVDVVQTNAFVGECREANPIIGQCGGGVPVAPYFLTAFLIHSIAVTVLPKRLRASFQWFSIGVVSATVVHNQFFR